MRTLLKIITTIIGLVALSALHIGLSYLLPYPLAKFNVIFCVLILLMLWWRSGLIVWVSFFCHLFIELFTVSPFGLILFSGTMGILGAFWLYKYVFTNRSWYAAVVVSGLSLVVYRTFYILIATGLYFFKVINYLPWKLVFLTLFWEFIFTVSVVAIIYLLFSRFTNRFQATVIDSSIFRYGKK
jgi:hypothetical protein